MRGLVGPVTQVRSIVPEPAHADAHARREKIPDVRFPQENPIAVELRQVTTQSGAGDTGVAVTAHFHVDPLKVSAQKNRSSGIRRTGQETLGTPYEQVMTD